MSILFYSSLLNRLVNASASKSVAQFQPQYEKKLRFNSVNGFYGTVRIYCIFLGYDIRTAFVSIHVAIHCGYAEVLILFSLTIKCHSLMVSIQFQIYGFSVFL